jgi:hypothetical protein
MQTADFVNVRWWRRRRFCIRSPSCYAGFNFRPTRPGQPSSARCATFSIPVGIKILKLFLRAHLLIVSQSFVKPSCATRFAQNSLSSAKEASSLKEDTSISTPAFFTNFINVITRKYFAFKTILNAKLVEKHFLNPQARIIWTVTLEKLCKKMDQSEHQKNMFQFHVFTNAAQYVSSRQANFRERVDQQAINPCWSIPRFAPLNGLVTPSNFYKLAATKGARFRCSCLGVWGNKQPTHPLFRQQKDAGTFCMIVCWGARIKGCTRDARGGIEGTERNRQTRRIHFHFTASGMGRQNGLLK